MPQGPFSNGLTPGFPALAPTYTHRAVPGGGGQGVLEVQGGAQGTASSTVTIGGSPALGQVVTVNINGVPVTYNIVSGDTTTTVATGVKNAINANSALTGVATAGSSTNVVTITASNAGVTFPLSSSVSNANATGTVTVAGTFGAGRALSITIGNAAGGGTVVVNYTTVAGDTTATILAASLVNAINASAAVLGPAAGAAPNGTPSIQQATSAAGVITLLALVTGSAGQAISLAAAGAGGTTLTASGANLTGGTSVLTAVANAADLDLANTVDPASTFANAGTAGAMGAYTFYQGMPTDVDAGMKSDLRGQGLV